MAKTFTEIKNATIGNFDATINEVDELVITGIYQGTAISQTIGCPPPCLVFIDPNNSSIQVVHIEGMDPSWELVKFIKEVS